MSFPCNFSNCSKCDNFNVYRLPITFVTAFTTPFSVILIELLLSVTESSLTTPWIPVESQFGVSPSIFMSKSSIESVPEL